MPYIDKDERKPFDKHIDGLISTLTKEGSTFNVGELNYCISRIIWGLWKKASRYTPGNNLVGVLECVKMEFYRRLLGSYENKMMKLNGDIKGKTK